MLAEHGLAGVVEPAKGVVDVGFGDDKRRHKAQRHAARGADFNWQISIGYSYYMVYALHPTLASVREGVYGAYDMADYTWEKFSFDYFRRLHDEMMGYFPMRWKQLEFYNSNLVANLAFGMLKSFMNYNIRNTAKLGCRLDGTSQDGSPRRLRDIHNQSFPEITQRVRELLTLRAHHERTFRL